MATCHSSGDRFPSELRNFASLKRQVEEIKSSTEDEFYSEVNILFNFSTTFSDIVFNQVLRPDLKRS